MKFNSDFVEKIKDKNPKLLKSKKFTPIKTEFILNQTISSKKYMKTFSDFYNNDLRADNSLNTKLDKSGFDQLKTKYDIDVTKFPKHSLKDIYKSYKENDGEIHFINDYIPIKTRNKKQNKEVNQLLSSPIFSLDDETISSLEYYKGVLILNAKKYDNDKYGTITKEEAISALLHSNISDKIDLNLSKSIVEFYNKTDNVEYMKFIARIIKDAQNYLLIKNAKSELKILEKKDSLFDLKSNLKNGKQIFNKMNKSCSNEFFPYRKLNISRTPIDNNINNSKFLPNIKGKKIKFKSNLRYIQEETKNDILSHNTSFEAEKELDLFNNYNNLDEIKSMINNIKLIIPELRQKYLISISQNISSFEFLNILKNYNISYQKDVLDNLLLFLGIKDINAL